MPYIITTKPASVTTGSIAGTQEWDATTGEPHAVSRRAVGTLDEAREKAAYTIAQGWATDAVGQWWLEAQRLPDSGGTIGPLPDGTVVEVKPYSYPAMLAYIEDSSGDTRFADFPNTTNGAEIIDAYNTAQED